MPFCTSCGNEIDANNKFCEYCGAPTGISGTPQMPQSSEQQQSALPQQPPSQQPLVQGEPTLPVSAEASLGLQPPVDEPAAADSPPVAMVATPPQQATAARHWNNKIIIAVLAGILIIAAAGVVVMPRLGIFSGSAISPIPSPVQTTVLTTATTLSTPVIMSIVPTPAPDPFPDALALREWFAYNEGKYASKATVYRYWLNDTYQWHNDNDNKWYTEPQRPDPGNKYLIVYVDIVNLGTNAYPYPKSNNIYVHYDGEIYSTDPSHYIPDKAGDRDAAPVEIGEIQQQSDLFNLEYVEDYGYSHGTTSDFVYPGQSHAIDGYLIYKVPMSLTPDRTYVEIIFDGDDTAVWKLA